ncbi:pyridoxine kinase [Amaricoccus macauensis]|uniref:pyridoxal kinase n=1 Tax=Amaricoccus macauensis TaxID=57001 RepID=A0A840STU6_9RHOB|nr:bifunctional hydroxymethylpyrimidine kinase/phosphomethylpyrimidine kinase [Amaricoccus macauensis]MBB5222713.1 pyridoxine kinase [Amaricoccus macauensis]
MARILVLSSWTSAGHVGLSAAVPALQALGHVPLQLPTIVLSNEPGFAHTAGDRIPPEQLAAMIDALEGNGWLSGLDALLTGYLPSAAHVEIAVGLVARIRRLSPAARVVVDPILGDTAEGLYLDPVAAAGVRDRLVPLADILTPNGFELGWLSGQGIATLAEAVAAARDLGARVLVTTPPLTDAAGVLDVGPGAPVLYETPQFRDVPHGVGDVFSALIAAGEPVGAAVGHLAALCAASSGAEHLALVPASAWMAALPVAGRSLAESEG